MTVSDFSAVAYFFGREIQREAGVPIGLIDASWGGTLAEAWTNAGALKPLPDFRDALARIEDRGKLRGSNERYDRAMAAWWTQVDQGVAAGAH